MYGLEGIEAGNGITLMIAGMAVVFVALVVLLFLMKFLKRGIIFMHAAQSRREAAHDAKLAAQSGEDRGESGIRAIEGPEGQDVSGVEIAAIALTLLFESEQMHDNESMVLTMHNLPMPYSNWWQGRMDPAWRAAVTPGRSVTLQTRDPERGTRV